MIEPKFVDIVRVGKFVESFQGAAVLISACNQVMRVDEVVLKMERKNENIQRNKIEEAESRLKMRTNTFIGEYV